MILEPWKTTYFFIGKQPHTLEWGIFSNAKILICAAGMWYVIILIASNNLNHLSEVSFPMRIYSSM
jgi:hypothetical protein